MIEIRLTDRNGTCLAQASGEEETFLCADRVYEPGDCIEISGAERLRIKMDQGISSAEVYLPSGKMHWRIPDGEQRLAYAPGTFEAARHLILAAWIPEKATGQERNLALNPADLRGDTDFFPHCTANVETRNEACFCARNVIDGLRINSGHGVWPYQSWGTGNRTDAWCRIDFGRPVSIHKMALTLRADFPHDTCWTKATVVLEDGYSRTFDLRKEAGRQWISLEGIHTVSWVRIEQLIKSEDDFAFAALRQWEVYGTETA